jgi:hypothetical protein
MWIYDQSSGILSREGRVIAKGYSGRGDAKNNPALQHLRATGPIPRGDWRITILQRHHPNLGPYVLHLEPESGTDTKGRSAFRIHGDSIKAPGTASHGCIILPRAIREQIWQSGDRALKVVE